MDSAPGSNKFTKYQNIYGDLGGSIIKDKLWFYGAFTDGYQGTFIPGFISLKTASRPNTSPRSSTPPRN